MSKSAFAMALCVGVAAISPAAAAQLSLRFVTADGTWDCKDAADTRVGALIIADTTYAFVTTEGKIAGYGAIRSVDGDFDLPKYTVLTGHLKDEKKVLGLTLRGPKENTEKVDGEIFLHGVISFDGKQDWDCARRGGRANQPPA